MNNVNQKEEKKTIIRKNDDVRVRFAPSPTGLLHIGGVRTALFNWLFARQKEGKCLLRIEDTDTERSKDIYVEDIMNSLKWLGLDWDEEAIFQSKRMDIYKAKAEELIKKELAYHCTCTPEEVQEMRARALAEGRKPKYDGRCRGLGIKSTDDKPSVIRIKLPQDGTVTFNDMIHGELSVENKELDDFIIVRSNGAPTYNFTVVVDEIECGITHVIRGDDHLNNTPKQIHIFNYFKYKIPIFAHLPMILGSDKKKLSKRHGAVSASTYREEGFLPEALLNFLARLGWSHGDEEVFTIDELIEKFSFDNVQKSQAVFNREKLVWVNGVHLANADPLRVQKILVKDFIQKFPLELRSFLDTWRSEKLITKIQPKVKKIDELIDELIPLFSTDKMNLDLRPLKWDKKPELKPKVFAAIKEAREYFSQIISERSKDFKREGVETNWGQIPSLEEVGIKVEEVEEYIKKLCETHQISLGQLAQPIRLAVVGRAVSAMGVFDLLWLLPWNIIETRFLELEKL